MKLSEKYGGFKSLDVLEDEIWKIAYNIVDQPNSKREDVYLILFLLLLQRDGYLENLECKDPVTLVSEISQRVYEKKFERGSAIVYLLGEFSPQLEMQRNLHALVLSLNSIDQVSLKYLFVNIFESILSRIIHFVGRSSGEFVLPEKLGLFLSKLVDVNKGGRIYNPFAGLASFGIYSNPEAQYVGQEINGFIYKIGLLRLLANGRLENSDYILGDSIDVWNPFAQKYDLIIANPPYGIQPKNNIEFPFGNTRSIEQFIIGNSLKDLTENGKLVLLLPQSFLYRTDSDKKLRKYLIENDLIDIVISLPDRVLENTDLRICIIVISVNKPMKRNVCFIDATKYAQEIPNSRVKQLNLYSVSKAIKESIDTDFIIQVENSEIEHNDYNLNVPLYFQKNYNGIALGKFTQSIAGTKSNKSTIGHFVRIRDLKGDLFSYKLTSSEVEVTEVPRYSMKIEESCLLLATRWKSLKPTIFEFSGEPIYISPDITAFRVDWNQIESEYLIDILKRDFVTDQLNSYRYGVVVPTIRVSDLMRVKIPLPGIEDQKVQINKSKQEYIKGKSEENEALVSALKKEMNDSIRIKKHNIMQHLNNVKSAASLLYDYMEENGGILKSEEIINPQKGITVKKRFSRMLESLQEAMSFVDSITDEIVFGDGEYLTLEKVLNECIEKGQHYDNVEIELFIDSLSYETDDDDKKIPNIEFSRLNFIEMYNNIFENAVRHGFTDKTKKYKFLIEVRFDPELSKTVISFSNNGNPFPKGIVERYCLKGEKAGPNANKGYGTWVACEIAKHFHGKIVAHDFRGEEFPVRIDLIIDNLTIIATL